MRYVPPQSKGDTANACNSSKLGHPYYLSYENMKAELIHFTDKLTQCNLFISGFELSQEAKALALTAHIAENLMTTIPSEDALFLAQELINRSSMEIKSIYSDPEETGKPPHFNFENSIVFEFDGFCAITIEQHIFYVIADTQKIYDLLYSHFKKEVQEWADTL